MDIANIIVDVIIYYLLFKFIVVAVAIIVIVIVVFVFVVLFIFIFVAVVVLIRVARAFLRFFNLLNNVIIEILYVALYSNIR